ncbi:MAG: hypothetical protein H6661_05285 [Ardenticatenaceae bacterium]|nr:hypothetical protein [Ardenticatenaceae bacterium]
MAFVVVALDPQREAAKSCKNTPGSAVRPGQELIRVRPRPSSPQPAHRHHRLFHLDLERFEDTYRLPSTTSAASPASTATPSRIILSGGGTGGSVGVKPSKWAASSPEFNTPTKPNDGMRAAINFRPGVEASSCP